MVTSVRIFLFILFLLATALSRADEVRFSEVVIEASFHVSQPVLAANLANNGRHVVLAGRTDDHTQRLAVYPIDQPEQPSLVMDADAHLIAFDVGRIGGHDDLFFVEPGRLSRYDFDKGEIVEFVAIRSIYGQQRTGKLVPIDFIRDINGDDLDDVVVPDTAGYRIRLQRADGTLADEIVLQGSSVMTLLDGRVTFQSLTLVSGDMTGDGMHDLAVWRGNKLHVYRQRAGYSFDTEPEVIKLGLGLQTEAELQSRVDGFGATNQDGLVETRISLVEDLNGDGLPDILTESLLNKGVFDKENDFRLHIARPENGTVNYIDREDALLASDGLQFGLTTTDLDDDGRKDLVIRKAQMSFGRVIRALLAGSVPMELHVYRMLDDDSYPENAGFITRTNVQFSVRSGQVDIPAILVADINNDDIKDLLIQTEPDELSIHFGIRDDGLFHENAVTRRMQLPRNGDLVSAKDLDNDGRADVIIRYDESDGGRLSQTVRLLLTR
jgi:hypothetical protein